MIERKIVAPRVASNLPVEHFIVSLSGIGDISATFLQVIELGYVNALEAMLTRATQSTLRARCCA